MRVVDWYSGTVIMCGWQAGMGLYCDVIRLSQCQSRFSSYCRREDSRWFVGSSAIGGGEGVAVMGGGDGRRYWREYGGGDKQCVAMRYS